MADSRHTRAGGGYRTQRTPLSDAFWICVKQAVARERQIETGTGVPSRMAVRKSLKELRDIEAGSREQGRLNPTIHVEIGGLAPDRSRLEVWNNVLFVCLITLSTAGARGNMIPVNRR
jgi:hypothetical protein